MENNVESKNEEISQDVESFGIEETKETQKWADQVNSKQGKRKIVENVRKNYYLFRDAQTKGHGSVNIISNDDGMDGK